MIEKIIDKIPFEKICEYLPFKWTLHSRDVRKGTNPVCYYSFCEKHSCKYLQARQSKLARHLRACNSPIKLYDCTKKNGAKDERL